MHIRKILFAVDPAAHTRAAEHTVARVARLTNAEVIVFCVLDGDFSASASFPEIQRIVDRLKKAGVPARDEWRAAQVSEVPGVIAAAASELHADLIAVGSRGLSDIRGLWLGSVSHRVIANSDCPILVVSDRVHDSRAPIRRILLAISGGGEVPHAIEATVEIARHSRARVLVLHARYLLPDDHVLYTETDQDSTELVEEVVARIAKFGIRAEGRSRLMNPDAAHEIVASARGWNADLIVIGSRRLSEFASLLLTATTDPVLNLSDRSVVVAERPAPLA